MPKFSLHRFSSPSTLRSIRPSLLCRFLSRYQTFFESRGLVVPRDGEPEALDYDTLVVILSTPDSNTPAELAHALYYVHELATPEAMDLLLEGRQKEGGRFRDEPAATPADVALETWCDDQDRLVRVHQRLSWSRIRSYEYFCTEAKPRRAKELARSLRQALERDLDDWYEAHQRGRGCRVLSHEKEGDLYLLVQHAHILSRQETIDNGRTTSLVFRPVRYGHAVYDARLGELRIHADTLGEKQLYRSKLGLHLFEDEHYFSDDTKLWLEPLRQQGPACLACGDIDGMESVRLREAQIRLGGETQLVHILKSLDVFKSLREQGQGFPDFGRIISAKFEVRFAGSPKARSVTLRPPNVTLLTRDGDGALVEEWMTRRGFTLSEAFVEDEAA